MAWRKTGAFHAAEEILVLTCDVCERDIGNEDGRRPLAHFRVSRHPNPGAIDDQEPAVVICSGNACGRLPIVPPVRTLPRPSVAVDRLPGYEGSVMTTMLTAFLMAVAAFLGKRWNDSSAENSQLRAQVASLKRQLARRDR